MSDSNNLNSEQQTVFNHLDLLVELAKRGVTVERVEGKWNIELPQPKAACSYARQVNLTRTEFSKEEIAKAFDVPLHMVDTKPHRRRTDKRTIPNGYRITARAGGFSYEEYMQQGWTDAQLIQYGFMERVAYTISVNENFVSFADDTRAPFDVPKSELLCQLLAALRTAILSAPAKA